MNYELFEKALAEKRISRRKLAGLLGVNVNTFLSALGRKSDLDPDTVARIAKILEVDYTELSLSRESWETLRAIEEDDERNQNEPGYWQSLIQSAPLKESTLDLLQKSDAYHFALKSSDAVRLTMLLEAYSVLNIKGRYEALKTVCNLTYVPEYVGGDVKPEMEVFGREDISDLVDAVDKIAEKKRGNEDGEG